MDRKALQNLAKMRLNDARALLGKKRWSAAYYLSGYAVECALKSCLLRHLGESGALFGDREYVKKHLADCWTHDLEKLIKLAGLEADFGAARAANLALYGFWEIVKDWNESSRYQEKTESQARALFEAITHRPDGVLQWFQGRW